ncbi:efflux RND transporter periplasmic adaptor subunit [Halosquirtibacter xylanolyticus]|uniref:efflux RND transporter periplasmic adaptor subunit n=1 Tax=Halosquirtibacter xylanolyticus TaxID=3374599 RepID=UPI0037480851|nr:efflux RND transporter periplasmic adaptor subunit [Prolixibacteraceae bacterium]
MKKVRFLLVFLLVLAITSCNNKQNRKKSPPPTVFVSEVTVKDIPYNLEFVGQTYGYKDISIRARVDGFLEGIYFKEGSIVKKGQLLYHIEPRQLEAKVNEAISQLANAKATLINANNLYERVAPLAEINALSQKDLDQATANKRSAIAQVKAAQAQVNYAKIELGYTHIYAPISGVIGQTKAKVGDYVGKSPNPVVLNEVSQIDSILVEFYLPEKTYLELMRIKYQLKENKIYSRSTVFTMFLADGSTFPEKGKLNFIDRSIDPSTGSLKAQVSFLNKNNIIRPGQYALIQATLGQIKDAILIPQKAVTELQGEFSVYVVNSNKVDYRKVEVGEKMKDMWHINKGLKKGDIVITDGLMAVKNGMEVTPKMNR